MSWCFGRQLAAEFGNPGLSRGEGARSSRMTATWCGHDFSSYAPTVPATRSQKKRCANELRCREDASDARSSALPWRGDLSGVPTSNSAFAGPFGRKLLLGSRPASSRKSMRHSGRTRRCPHIFPGCSAAVSPLSHAARTKRSIIFATCVVFLKVKSLQIHRALDAQMLPRPVTGCPPRSPRITLAEPCCRAERGAPRCL